MILREELKAIRAELGLEKPQTETLLAKFKERMARLKIPGPAKKVMDEEMVSSLLCIERNYTNICIQGQIEADAEQLS